MTYMQDISLLILLNRFGVDVPMRFVLNYQYDLLCTNVLSFTEVRDIVRF